MRTRILVLMMIAALILAACGSDESQPDAPTPTPVPTMTVAERMTFPPGTTENPLQMVLVPTDTIPERVHLIAKTVLDKNVTDATELDLVDNTELLDQLNLYLERDFSFMIDDPSGIANVSDLTARVMAGVKTQAETALFDVTRLNFELVMVENHGLALTALCESSSGLVSMSWLDGVTYFAAQALNCSQPSQHDLLIAVAEESEPDFVAVDFLPESVSAAENTPESTPADNDEATGESSEATPAPTLEPTPIPDTVSRPRFSGDLFTGVPGLIVMSSDLEGSGLQEIPTGAFCRVDVTDFFSWFVPMLIMERDNLMPAETLDFQDSARIARAIRDGDCLGSGMSQIDYDNLAGSLQSDLSVLETTPQFPYGVLMYPLDLQLGERVNLSENLPALAADGAASRPLRLLLGQDAFLPTEEGAFADLEAFLLVAGADLEQFGR